MSLAGTASIVWDGPEVRATEGAQRILRVRVRRGVRIGEVLPFTWGDPVFAPQFARR